MRCLLQFDALSISTCNRNGTTVASASGRGATGQISNATSAEQDLSNGINNLTIQPTVVGPMRLKRHRVRVNPVPARRKQRAVMQQGKVHLYYYQRHHPL